MTVASPSQPALSDASLNAVPEDLHARRLVLPAGNRFTWSGSGEIVTITVTESDIQTAVRGDSNACAIVQAAARAGVELQIGQDGTARVHEDGAWQTVHGAAELRKWVRDFDAGRPVMPLTISYARRPFLSP